MSKQVTDDKFVPDMSVKSVVAAEPGWKARFVNCTVDVGFWALLGCDIVVGMVYDPEMKAFCPILDYGADFLGIEKAQSQHVLAPFLTRCVG